VLIFGHTFRMMSMIQCDSSNYHLCVASLSVDGIVSLISVEDLMIVLHNLFLANSQCLIADATHSRLIFAVQTSLVRLLSRSPASGRPCAPAG
jgi:selenocysteine-specific translation elongation factor